MLFAVIGLAASLYWEILGGPALLMQTDPMHVVLFPIGLALAGLQEYASPDSQLRYRVPRVRGVVYLWQSVVGLADLIGSVGIPFDSVQRFPGSPLFPGAVQALHCVYLAMTFDLVVLRPIEVWFGSASGAFRRRVLPRDRVRR